MITPNVTEMITVAGTLLISPDGFVRRFIKLESDAEYRRVIGITIRREGFGMIRVPVDDIEDFQAAVAAAAETARQWKQDGLPPRLEELMQYSDSDDDDDPELSEMTA